MGKVTLPVDTVSQAMCPVLMYVGQIVDHSSPDHSRHSVRQFGTQATLSMPLSVCFDFNGLAELTKSCLLKQTLLSITVLSLCLDSA